MTAEPYAFRGSSVVKAATYDDEAHALTIDFHNGNRATVPNVGPAKWAAFRRADSPGRFVNEHFGPQTAKHRAGRD